MYQCITNFRKWRPSVDLPEAMEGLFPYAHYSPSLDPGPCSFVPTLGRGLTDMFP